MTAGSTGAERPGHVVHLLGGATMGTRWQASVSAPRGVDLRPLHDGVQACLDRVVAQMSTWEHDADISRYNRAPAGSWHALPQPFLGVLRRALEIARDTGGACDPTVGPLVRQWGFGAYGDGGHVPAADALAEARRCVGWERVHVDDTGGRVLQPGGVELDLSGIAKGHGVDAAVEWLRDHGVAAALVEVGGELRGHGHKPDGTPWQVLVEAWPEDGDDDTGDTSQPTPCILRLEDVAVATSGDHWHRFEYDGRLYSHTLDPRTGAPVDHAPAAVTVVATDALTADAWATALTVLGPEAGFATAQARGIAARFVTRDGDGTPRMTEAFLGHLAPGQDAA